MKFLLDTHVLFWTLTLQKTKLTKKVTKTLEEADELILPTIVLLELSGLLQKKQGDRYLVATAKILDIPIITKDKEIAKVYKKIIW